MKSGWEARPTEEKAFGLVEPEAEASEIEWAAERLVEALRHARGDIGRVFGRRYLVVVGTGVPFAIIGKDGPEAGFTLGKDDFGRRQALKVGQLEQLRSSLGY